MLPNFPKHFDQTAKLNNCHNSINDTLRTLKVTRTSADVENFNETTCGPDSFRRGPGQKVVGFCFYGDPNSQQSIDRGYFEGIGENLKLLPIYYSGTVELRRLVWSQLILSASYCDHIQNPPLHKKSSVIVIIRLMCLKVLSFKVITESGFIKHILGNLKKAKQRHAASLFCWVGFQFQIGHLLLKIQITFIMNVKN